MALLYEKVVSIVNKDPDDRDDVEIEHILPWFRKKSELFKSQKAEIVKDIVKNCQFMTCRRDFVIIKQGDKGDCFYIILNGSVAIHIQTNLGEEGIQYQEPDPSSEKPKELDRSRFGNYVGKIPAGRSFGELALINSDCVRNASIISDEVTDLLVVNRELYSRSLKAFQEKEFEERKRFVEEYPLFKNWHPRYKKQLAMSLRKEKLLFDGIAVKQGCPLDGLCFILSGQVKMLVDPVQHEVQYPELFPLPNIEELEKVEARESIRREMNMAAPKIEERKPTYYRSRSPTVDGRKRSHRTIEMCVIGAVEMIGDLEMIMGLSSYTQTAQCTEQTEVFILDQKNYERLVEKRNPVTIDAMRASVLEKLKLRLKWVHENDIPMFNYFLYKLEERKRHEIEKERYMEKKRREWKENTSSEWRIDQLQRGPLIDPQGPGSIFYSIRMREKNKRVPLKTAGAAGFGITRHIGKPHSIAYLARKHGNSNLNNNAMQTNGDEDNAQETDENDDNNSQTGDTDMDDVDAPRVTRRNRFLCDDGSDPHNTRRYSRSDRSRSERSLNDYINLEINEASLNRLEDRIEAWHSKIEEKTARKHLVKLHRYNAEDHQKPLPGKTIVLKPKTKAKPCMLKLQLEALVEDNNTTSSPPLPEDGHGLSADMFPYPGSQSESAYRTSPLSEYRPKRPLSSRTDVTSSVIHIRRRPKSAHQYTAEEYGHLKEELRRKQRAYKSMLTRATSFYG